MQKRNYQFFTTALPDQFIQANMDAIADACRNWQDPNVFMKQAIVIDGVSLALCGNRAAHTIPTIASNSPTQIRNWMNKYGDSFNGRYWKTFAENNRGSGGKSNPRTTIRTGLPPQTYRGVPIHTIDPNDLAGKGALTFKDYAAMIGVGPSILPLRGEFFVEVRPALHRETFACGEIIAHRCWLVMDNRLRSVYQSDFWHPDEVLTGRGLDDWDSRGIHAWKDGVGKHFFEYIREYLNQDGFTNPFRHDCGPRPSIVTGRVALWGDVVEHEHGYRAEYARVKSLDWLYPDQSQMGREAEVLAHLRELYHV